MNRRAIGRGRLIVAIAAVLLLAGTVPPWWAIGGIVTPALSGNAFEGAGILVFIGAVALLALIVLPYASREGDSRLDRAWSYVGVAALVVVGFVARVVQINEFGGLALPDRAPGLWITGAGLLLLVWGVAEIVGERPAEY